MNRREAMLAGAAVTVAAVAPATNAAASKPRKPSGWFRYTIDVCPDTMTCKVGAEFHDETKQFPLVLVHPMRAENSFIPYTAQMDDGRHVSYGVPFMQTLSFTYYDEKHLNESILKAAAAIRNNTAPA